MLVISECNGVALKRNVASTSQREEEQGVPALPVGRATTLVRSRQSTGISESLLGVASERFSALRILRHALVVALVRRLELLELVLRAHDSLAISKRQHDEAHLTQFRGLDLAGEVDLVLRA